MFGALAFERLAGFGLRFWRNWIGEGWKQAMSLAIRTIATIKQQGSQK
jgi:hypothetical protein